MIQFRKNNTRFLKSQSLIGLLGLILLALFGCSMNTGNMPDSATFELPAGVTLIEKVNASSNTNEIVIPYSKYKLDNGLTVILHEDNSDPLVHVDVTYHVGSGREDIGKSGFAHFFEHMQFQGSENVADEEHFKIVSESGGTLNGSTSTDRTNYYQTVPNNQLEKMLWLESDRMGYFLDAVTQEKFEVQRETVKNERGQRVDNRPYGLLWEKVGEAMYPEGHPYSWTTIGYLEDLDRANLFDLKKFFLRWYGPNNATLTIGGDLDVAQTLEWVVTYFADIPAGPEVSMPTPQPAKLDVDRYISYEDNISLPLIYFSFPTVSGRHVDEAPLDVLADILGGGKTSLLYKNMVKNGLAVQANANHYCAELACSLSLLALPNPASGKNLSDLDTIIRESLAEFETRGVKDDDIERVKASIVSGMIYGLESVSGKVRQLAAYETYTNNPNYIKQDLKRYQNVSKADVMRVYQQYIKDKPAVILSIVQNGKPETVAKTDTYVHQPRTIPETENAKESDLEYRVANSRIDRSKRPVAIGNPSVKLPQLHRSKLKNGIALLNAANKEVPTTAISVRVNSGHRDDPLDKVGLSTLTAMMLNESTTESSNEELSNRLEKLGSRVNFSSNDNYSTISIKSLTENLGATLDIAAERLFKPAFAQDDFDRVKDQLLESIEQSKKQAAQTASNVNRHILYGKKNSFAFPGQGTKESVENISLDDVKTFYATRYSPTITDIIAVSDLNQKNLIKNLSVFADWKGPEVPTTPLQPFPSHTKSTIYFVDKPDAAQSEIRVAKRALPFDATGEYYRAGLMNYALGGAFNSRININLREDKGYTYGARSGFYGDKEYGSFSAGAGVRADATAASLTEFIKEINEYYADGINADELSFTKNSIGQRDARSYETPNQKLGFLSQIQTYNLSDTFVDEQKTILANLTEEEVDALAKKHLSLKEMNIVIVGDKATVMDELKAFGYDIVELDADGNKL